MVSLFHRLDFINTVLGQRVFTFNSAIDIADLQKSLDQTSVASSEMFVAKGWKC